ncbi:hypothetical protein SAMN05444374_11667 [Rhodococcoides kroppenstedtii]|uniref:Uncharacterized protein n=1 Tax=Rhodococcoides kroppenstedtii TaxID=293050 RepID=A0A1I0UAI4_9NOCA|nr:hypothetical protein [Rhodococcus kroppenstedtii]SFA60930.1 hypothetical protein SAMN05444374_11667 [Rhodococcus kroppenstedtii]
MSTDWNIWDNVIVEMVTPGIAYAEYVGTNGVPGTHLPDLRDLARYWVGDPDSLYFASAFTVDDLATALSVVEMLRNDVDPANFGHPSRQTPDKVRAALLVAERDRLIDRIEELAEDRNGITAVLDEMAKTQ